MPQRLSRSGGPVGSDQIECVIGLRQQEQGRLDTDLVQLCHHLDSWIWRHDDVVAAPASTELADNRRARAQSVKATCTALGPARECRRRSSPIDHRLDHFATQGGRRLHRASVAASVTQAHSSPAYAASSPQAWRFRSVGSTRQGRPDCTSQERPGQKCRRRGRPLELTPDARWCKPRAARRGHRLSHHR